MRCKVRSCDRCHLAATERVISDGQHVETVEDTTHDRSSGFDF